MMKVRLKTVLGMGAVVLATAACADSDTSDPLLVFTQPATSSFWTTAPGTTMTLPIDYPEGATTATLGVTGAVYAVEYAGITAAEYALTLPAATDAYTEDVYALTLTFDDGTVRTARLGLVKGLGNGAEGATRCLTNPNAAKWKRTASHAVIPVPYGATDFTVNGAAVQAGDAGFTGAQGWYALQNLKLNATVPVSLTLDGETATIPLTIRNRAGFLYYVH